MRKCRNCKPQGSTSKAILRINHKIFARTNTRIERRLLHRRKLEFTAGNSQTGTPLFPSLVNFRSNNVGLLKTSSQILKNLQSQANDQTCSRSRKHKWWQKLPKLELWSLQKTSNGTGITGKLTSLILFNLCTYDACRNKSRK